jgi:hypothetical protein
MTAVLSVIPAEAMRKQESRFSTPDRVRGDGVHSRKSHKSFGICYKCIRAKFGVSQTEFASLLGISCDRTGKRE